MVDKNPHVAKQLSKNPKFETGDVVKLAAGGPSMSVRGILGEEITCEWFDKGTLKSHTFVRAQLVHTNPEQVPVLNIKFGGDSKKDNDVPPWERVKG